MGIVLVLGYACIQGALWSGTEDRHLRRTLRLVCRLLLQRDHQRNSFWYPAGHDGIGHRVWDWLSMPWRR